MEQTTQNQQVNQKKGKSKLPLAMLAGAAVGGALALISSNTRSSVKNSTSNAKDTISTYTTQVKEDPQASKEKLMARIRKITAVTKEVVTQIQSVIDNEGQELRQKVEDIKADTQDAVSTAKDAKEELKSVGDTAKDAKDELKPSSTDGEGGENTNDSSHQVASTPVN